MYVKSRIYCLLLNSRCIYTTLKCFFVWFIVSSVQIRSFWDSFSFIFIYFQYFTWNIHYYFFPNFLRRPSNLLNYLFLNNFYWWIKHQRECEKSLYQNKKVHKLQINKRLSTENRSSSISLYCSNHWYSTSLTTLYSIWKETDSRWKL